MSLRRISDSGRSSRAPSWCVSARAKPCPGKCLPTAPMPASAKPRMIARRGPPARGVEMQRAVADHAASTVVEVEHRREAEVDAVRAELRADDVRRGARRLFRQVPVTVPQPAELAHRRDAAEAVAEPLHPAAFMVDADRQCRLSQLSISSTNALELVWVLVIPGKQNHPPAAGCRRRSRSSSVSTTPPRRATTGPGGSPYFRIPGSRWLRRCRSSASERWGA